MPVRAALVLAALLAWPLAVPAHRLSLEVRQEAGRIVGEAAYLPGGVAAEVPVRLRDAQGALLQETRTDAAGRFVMEAPPAGGVLVECVTPDGHRAEAPAPAYAPALTGPASADPAEPAPVAGAPDPGALEAALARELRPVLDRLKRLEESTRLRDILGGIGYIVGFAGLLALVKSRPRGNG
jgi:nickel transport protein